MDIKRFKRLPIMGILRGAPLSSIEPLMEAAASAGLETIEITMNAPDATESIGRAVKASGTRLMIGAGTVLDIGSLRAALDAGARFIVTPVLIDDVTAYCAKNKIPVFPGALTPGEIYAAWKAGAAMVKVFPARFFGPGYFKELKGPFNDIELLACGGVSADNIKEYLSAGASAVAFGASIFRKDWIEKGDYGKITEAIKGLIGNLPICL